MNQTELRSSKLQAKPDILVKFFKELRSSNFEVEQMSAKATDAKTIFHAIKKR